MPVAPQNALAGRIRGGMGIVRYTWAYKRVPPPDHMATARGGLAAAGVECTLTGPYQKKNQPPA